MKITSDNIFAVVLVVVIGFFVISWANDNYLHIFESEDNQFAREFCESLQKDGKLGEGKAELSKCKWDMADVQREIDPSTKCHRKTNTVEQYAECMKEVYTP